MSRPRVIAAALLLAAAAACGGPKSGEVISKHSEPAHEWVQMVCGAYNSKGLCNVWVPIYQHEPERWYVTVQDNDGNRGDLEVSQTDYGHIHLGQTWGERS